MPDNLARPLHSSSNRDFPMPLAPWITQLPAAVASRGETPASRFDSAARSNGCAPPIVGNDKPLTPVR